MKLIKTWIFISVIFLIVMSFLLSRGYEGDGEYQSSGIWPFVTYELKLPPFELSSQNVVSYKIRGYKSHGTSHLLIKLISDTPLQFTKLDTILEVKVSGGYTTYFYRKSPFNAHYRRMLELGASDGANELEWNGLYQYSSDLHKRGVYFSPTEKPEKTMQIMYAESLPTGTDDLNIRIKVGDVSQEFQNIKVHIEFLSGWK